ncbi:hypothetical protein NSK_006253 [Nannochloropsis salina CCMP1776]|uniref:Protein kinase domain-containing protein n=1 Tax=Nannochloropsis salina CCMP1776 TaxID=1027361 RepID=A0A4D9CWE3_9STRA|nr:hypothetical protein NSK_006253 [Nannochloropsis salina CCMP1776]|eukprot:TFJ82427.1 hypothetical protein NSK_006253 [Nannochloropsis salina CCMP1776]
MYLFKSKKKPAGKGGSPYGYKEKINDHERPYNLHYRKQEQPQPGFRYQVNPQHGHVLGLPPLEHVHPISPENDSWQRHGGQGFYTANDPCLRDQGYYHHAPPYQPQGNGGDRHTLDKRHGWPACQGAKMQSIIGDEQDAHTAATFVFDEDEYSSYDSYSNPIPTGRLRQYPPPQHRRQQPQGGGHRYNFFLSPLRGSKRQQSAAAAAAPTQGDLPTYQFPPQSQPQCHNENGRGGGYVHRIHPFPTEKGLQTQDPRSPERHEQRGTGRQLEPLGEPNLSLHQDDGGADDLSSSLPRTPRGSDSLPLPPLAGGRPRQVMGQYEILETLGKGMSGKVKKARHILTGQEVALKIIDKSKAVKRTLLQLRTEITALKTVRHPNVLELLHVELDAIYVKKNGTKVPSIALALQLAAGGELFDFMMYTGYFREVVARTLFRQLVGAMQYCHDRNIYHRDIKPENLLLDSNFQLKIADFGLAAIRSDPLDVLRTECGTRSYMAPEILQHEGYEGEKVDVWSMGVVLFILLAGNPPFQMARRGDWWFNALLENDWERFWKAHLKYAPHFPPAAQTFLSSLFQPIPSRRPNTEQVLHSEWLAGPCLTPDQLHAEMAARQANVAREKAKEREKVKAEKLRKAQEAQAAAAAVARARGTSTADGPGMSGLAPHNAVATAVSDVTCGSDVMFQDHMTRRRSVSGGEGEVEVVGLAEGGEEGMKGGGGGRNRKQAPLLPSEKGLKAYTYFYSHASDSEELLDRLHFVLMMRMSATIKPREHTQQEEAENAGFHLRCLVPLTAAKVRMDVRLWRVEDEGEGGEEGGKVVLHVVEAVRKEGDPVLFHRLYNNLKRKVVEEERVTAGKMGMLESELALPWLLPATPSREARTEATEAGVEGGRESGKEGEDEYPPPEPLYEERMSDLVEML